MAGRKWNKAMNNVMTINGFQAVISYEPEVELFRGEFVNLNGGADFYANNVRDLKKEGAESLKTFLDICEEKGIEPRRNFSGKFLLRVPPSTHEAAAIAAQASGKSLNQWVKGIIETSTHT
jgi:predicted HicB family RNase H-like nuclease